MPQFINFLTDDEKKWFSAAADKFDFKTTAYYAKLAESCNALRSQVIPTIAELSSRDYERSDPLSEKQYSPLPRMVHRYPNRIAVLVTDSCAVHCRHCFRRNFTGNRQGELTPGELKNILAYVHEHQEVQEILLTGGDPLTLENETLYRLMGNFRGCRPNVIFRLASRIPAVLPQKITPPFAKGLSAFAPLWMMVQFNHPAEFTPASKKALGNIRRAGIPMANQAVLLKGVNDDSAILAELFQELVTHGVKPYYLFQGDLARGTSHFRVPLEKGWQIMEELNGMISGLAMPVYAVDLPGGGGKIPLHQSMFQEKRKDGYVFKGIDGKSYIYPKEGL